MLDIKSLMTSVLNFPWELIGIERPMVGQVHSYLAEILSIYEPNNREFYNSHPTLRELDRFAKASEGPTVAKSIVEFCERLYDRPRSERRNVDAEVLEYLSYQPKFIQDLREEMLRKHREGSITINPKYLRVF